MARRLLFAASLGLACCSAACGDNQTHLPPDHAVYTYDAGTLSCVPNLDGTIDADELAPALGVDVHYLISPQGTDRTVDLVGAIVDGQRQWDFSVDYADDAEVTMTATALEGKWYASSFPNGEFTAPFDAAHTLDGVYRHDQDALWLLGLASVDPSPTTGQTLVAYDTPIALVRFPLTAGASWVSTGTVTNGTIDGLPYAGKDVYQIEDQETGTLVLRDVRYQQAHKLRTAVTISPAVGTATTQRQVSFFSECFGEVTRATSKPGETDPDFTDAMELRRLGITLSN